MANSPQKRRADVALDEPATVSRSGRVRKPKVFYDPSEVVAKRRSVPISVEASKPIQTKSIKFTEPQSSPSSSVRPEPIEIKSPPKKVSPVIEKPKAKAASIGNNRRKTVCVASVYDDDGNGCIVCERCDTKKGRFVTCIDCDKRGHFTCLRTEKLFKTADQEGNWQCPSCKICEYCGENKLNELLYKCIICSSSLHLQCSNKIAPQVKSVVKKKFTCGYCIKSTHMHAKQIDPPRPVLPNRKSEGFPGFGHFETTIKSDLKSNDKTTTTTTMTTKKAVFFPKTQEPKSTKSSPGSNSCSNDARNVGADTDVKTEKKSPTPDQEYGSSGGVRAHKINDILDDILATYNQPISSQPISVRKDLVQPTVSRQHPATTSKAKETKQQNGYDDSMDIKYDSKTVITPHESIPDVRKWDVDEVYTYFLGKDTPEFAKILRDHQIDGDALLLIKREDVLNRFNLKLGAALRLYAHIVSIQYKNNNPILAWNEF